MGLGTGSGTLLASEKEHCYLLELSVANANQLNAPPKLSRNIWVQRGRHSHLSFPALELSGAPCCTIS